VVTPRFDAEIHAPLRLRICAMLAVAKAVDFATIRDTLHVADSVVSKHVARLESVGYVTVAKVPGGPRQRTWISLTARGRTAFAQHTAALRQILDDAAQWEGTVPLAGAGPLPGVADRDGAQAGSDGAQAGSDGAQAGSDGAQAGSRRRR